MEAVAAFVDLLAALAVALIELTVFLLTLLFSASFLATRHKGLERACYVRAVLAVLAAVYLLFGLARGFVPAFASPTLGQFYCVPAFVVVLVFLILLISMPTGLRRADKPNATRQEKRVYGLSDALAFSIAFGDFALWTQTKRVTRLEERFCDKALAGVDEKWLKRAGKLDRWRADKRSKELSAISLCLSK